MEAGAIRNTAGRYSGVAIFGATHREAALGKVARFISSLAERGYFSIVEQALYEALRDKRFLVEAYDTFEELAPREVAFAVSFGGDGTFLRSLHRLSDPETPILAINSGHLGFLTDVDADEVLEMVERLTEGDFRIEERSLLALFAGGRQVCCAFNEIAIQKRETGSMINVDTYLNDHYLARYTGDGLIVATPAGSTAYSLSLSGPIVAPLCPVLLLTPVAPHSLNMRPMVVPDHAEIRMKVDSRSSTFMIVADGKLTVFPVNTTIVVKSAGRTVRLIKLSERSFAETIRKKLLWGEQPRLG